MKTPRLAELLQDAFQPILGADGITIVPQGDKLLSVDGGDWQVRFTGWPDQPEAKVELSRDEGDEQSGGERRKEVMAYEVDEAFAYVDAKVSGQITTALKASGDPLSLDMLESLATHKQRFLESGIVIDEVA